MKKIFVPLMLVALASCQDEVATVKPSESVKTASNRQTVIGPPIFVPFAEPYLEDVNHRRIMPGEMLSGFTDYYVVIEAYPPDYTGPAPRRMISTIALLPVEGIAQPALPFVLDVPTGFASPWGGPVTVRYGRRFLIRTNEDKKDIEKIDIRYQGYRFIFDNATNVETIYPSQVEQRSLPQ